MSNWVVIAILIFLFLDFLVVLFIYFKRLHQRTFNSKQIQYIHSHWIRIIDSFTHYPKIAILDADKLLDYALNLKGFKGSMGDKLKKAGARFKDINSVWNAHKIRNKIAHDLVEIKPSEAKNALQQYKNALNDLGAKL